MPVNYLTLQLRNSVTIHFPKLYICRSTDEESKKFLLKSLPCCLVLDTKMAPAEDMQFKMSMLYTIRNVFSRIVNARGAIIDEVGLFTSNRKQSDMNTVPLSSVPIESDTVKEFFYPNSRRGQFPYPESERYDNRGIPRELHGEYNVSISAAMLKFFVSSGGDASKFFVETTAVKSVYSDPQKLGSFLAEDTLCIIIPIFQKYKGWKEQEMEAYALKTLRKRGKSRAVAEENEDIEASVKAMFVKDRHSYVDSYNEIVRTSSRVVQQNSTALVSGPPIKMPNGEIVGNCCSVCCSSMANLAGLCTFGTNDCMTSCGFGTKTEMLKNLITYFKMSRETAGTTTDVSSTMSATDEEQEDSIGDGGESGVSDEEPGGDIL